MSNSQRLNRVAKYLASHSLYKEASQIKKLAQMEESAGNFTPEQILMKGLWSHEVFAGEGSKKFIEENFSNEEIDAVRAVLEIVTENYNSREELFKISEDALKLMNIAPTSLAGILINKLINEPSHQSDVALYNRLFDNVAYTTPPAKIFQLHKSIIKSDENLNKEINKIVRVNKSPGTEMDNYGIQLVGGIIQILRDAGQEDKLKELNFLPLGWYPTLTKPTISQRWDDEQQRNVKYEVSPRLTREYVDSLKNQHKEWTIDQWFDVLLRLDAANDPGR